MTAETVATSVHSSIVHHSLKVEIIQISITEEYINKMWYIFTIERLFDIKNKILKLAE
jgi:hypothetical protein